MPIKITKKKTTISRLDLIPGSQLMVLSDTANVLGFGANSRFLALYADSSLMITPETFQPLPGGITIELRKVMHQMTITMPPLTASIPVIELLVNATGNDGYTFYQFEGADELEAQILSTTEVQLAITEDSKTSVTDASVVFSVSTTATTTNANATPVLATAVSNIPFAELPDALKGNDIATRGGVFGEIKTPEIFAFLGIVAGFANKIDTIVQSIKAAGPKNPLKLLLAIITPLSGSLSEIFLFYNAISNVKVIFEAYKALPAEEKAKLAAEFAAKFNIANDKIESIVELTFDFALKTEEYATKLIGLFKK